MLIGDRMSRPVITVSPDEPINNVLAMFKRERIRRAPVVKDGKLVGIITQTDLLNASPSPVTSLSVWELNYLLSKVTVSRIMTRKVRTVDVDTPIEEAARIMADTKIGGLPVMNGNRLVGMITETDLFKVFLEMMGARQKATRVTAVINDVRGELAKLTKTIAAAGGNFISLGMFTGPEAGTKIVTFKVLGLKKDAIRKALSKSVKKFWDIRVS
ncbi:MAG: CBS domain-containing protein [Anaerolineales bacterium]|nr:CBS domain-containing protein [Anaerolineales bacterium]